MQLMVGQAHNGAEDDLNARHGSVCERGLCSEIDVVNFIPSRHVQETGR